MALRQLIQQIADDWPGYLEKVRVDKNSQVYDLVVRQLPGALQAIVADHPTMIPEGSTGRGNVTDAPWVALFDRRLTVSATEEYYVVYLFSTDMLSVTLSLAFGTTQFQKQFGGPISAFPRMRAAATRLQETFNHLIPSHLARGPINLTATPRQKLHYAYQQASILSYQPYRIGALPEESVLRRDLEELVQLYEEIVSDPLEATVDRLVEAVIEPAPQVESIEVRDFEPREPRQQRNAVNSSKNRRRYSPESRKVGDAGERAVIRLEKDHLIALGRQDLAERVRWHSKEQEFPGWDVTSFNDSGSEIFIEVKSCAGTTVSCVDLTVNEWKAACDASRREHYYIYIVTNALSQRPKIERLRNPASYVDGRQLLCEPIVYELQLRKH